MPVGSLLGRPCSRACISNSWGEKETPVSMFVQGSFSSQCNGGLPGYVARADCWPSPASWSCSPLLWSFEYPSASVWCTRRTPAGWCLCSSARHCGHGAVSSSKQLFLIHITGLSKSKIYSQVIGFRNHGAQFLDAIIDVKPPPPLNYRRQNKTAWLEKESRSKSIRHEEQETRQENARL